MDEISVREQANRPSDPNVEVSWPRGDVARIALAGEHDMASAASLERSLDETLSQTPHAVIDLAEAEFIDSTTIRTLWRACQRAEQVGARFNVVIGNDAVTRRALELTGLLEPLHVVASFEEALST